MKKNESPLDARERWLRNRLLPIGLLVILAWALLVGVGALLAGDDLKLWRLVLPVGITAIFVAAWFALWSKRFRTPSQNQKKKSD